MRTQIEELEARGVVLTEQIRAAQKKGDSRRIDRLLRRKDRLNRKVGKLVLNVRS